MTEKAYAVVQPPLSLMSMNTRDELPPNIESDLAILMDNHTTAVAEQSTRQQAINSSSAQATTALAERSRGYSRGSCWKIRGRGSCWIPEEAAGRSLVEEASRPEDDPAGAEEVA